MFTSAGAMISLTSFLIYTLLMLNVAAAPIDIRAIQSRASTSEIDMSIWNLQLPTGEDHKPDTIATKSLVKLSGFENDFFFTNSNGSLVMKVPGSPSSSGCVTTAHSLHCRTELREVDAETGKAASWSPSDTNIMEATLQVLKAGDTVVGQIHIDDDVSSKPVCEIYYKGNGDISIGVEQTREGGNQVLTDLGNVPLGEIFSYKLEYSNDKLKVSINNKTTSLSTFELNSPKSYFKAGNYNQGDEASEVHFHSLTVQH